MTTTKHCPKCNLNRLAVEFYKNCGKPDGLASYCKSCWKAYQTPRVVKWMKENPEKAKHHRRNAKLKAKYGITVKQYDSLPLAQDGRCPICRRPPPPSGRRLAVDHDHKTGKVRGLLCADCNRAVGLMGDSPELLMRASLYLYSERR